VPRGDPALIAMSVLRARSATVMRQDASATFFHLLDGNSAPLYTSSAGISTMTDARQTRGDASPHCPAKPADELSIVKRVWCTDTRAGLKAPHYPMTPAEAGYPMHFFMVIGKLTKW